MRTYKNTRYFTLICVLGWTTRFLMFCWLTGNDEADYRSLFGVRLASEMHLNDRSFDTCLGIIVLGSDWSNLLLPAVRLEICRQLHAVSNSFTFITSEGFVDIGAFCL